MIEHIYLFKIGIVLQVLGALWFLVKRAPEKPPTSAELFEPLEQKIAERTEKEASEEPARVSVLDDNYRELRAKRDAANTVNQLSDGRRRAEEYAATLRAARTEYWFHEGGAIGLFILGLVAQLVSVF